MAAAAAGVGSSLSLSLSLFLLLCLLSVSVFVFVSGRAVQVNRPLNWNPTLWKRNGCSRRPAHRSQHQHHHRPQQCLLYSSGPLIPPLALAQISGPHPELS